MTALFLRHLSFTGPGRPTATIKFARGLNVLYGASETGKSFVLETIDYMLGAGTPLRDIPERVGYNQVLLGVESTKIGLFTLVRSVSGGGFRLFEGLHREVPPLEGRSMAPRYSAKNDDNISTFLLHNIDLYRKKIRTNKRGDTKDLSFRNISQLCLVGEGDIQKQGSPIEGGEPVQRTAEYATFKLLLTGIDDSALISNAQVAAVSQSTSAKLEVIDELIANYRMELQKITTDAENLPSQLEKLDQTMKQEQEDLHISENEYQGLINSRTERRKNLQSSLDRRAEIGELLARFALLDNHYESDLSRLESIREAGSLITLLEPSSCPLCGATSNQQHLQSDCDGNIEVVVIAANAESDKIMALRKELLETIQELRREAQNFDRIIPAMQNELKAIDERLVSLAPDLMNKRTTFSALAEKRAAIITALTIWKQIVDLENRRKALLGANDEQMDVPQEVVELSSVTLDRFSQKVEKILRDWHFPDIERVYFDETTRDLVIAGKRRGSRGKGMRAITHAAFSVGLLEFCMDLDLPHPGFLVLDSPLLAYREPEGTEDDLSGTDIQDRFYEYLANWKDRQIIIIENVDPPSFVMERPESVMFSKNSYKGRYGLFPPTLNA